MSPDKFLSGLPGIQKEGCDGIITSARFILHTRLPKHIREHRVSGILRPVGTVPCRPSSRSRAIWSAHPLAITGRTGACSTNRYIKGGRAYATKANRAEVAENVAAGRHRPANDEAR